MADRWSESGRSYLGRSHGRRTINFNSTVETRFIMRSQQDS
ncbi:hypothetical protein [Desnuesiella massiliensis]|nr:hypothetical protein [Desnuesiella massiliensis]